MIYDYFKKHLKKHPLTKDQVYQEIKDVFGEVKSQVDAYIESIELSDEFVDSAPTGKKNDFRERVQGKFLYFWEFRNKAMGGGRSALDHAKELSKVKKLFFKMIETDRFKNFKQVEPMIRAVRDEYCWDLLISSQGSKIDQVEAIFKEQKAIRSAEDKIRNFMRWLQHVDIQTFTKAAVKLLEELTLKASKILRKQK